MRLRRGKKSALRLRARHLFRDDHPALADRRVKRGVLGRIDDVDAARHHGDGAGLERGLMRRRVDAARQAGDDHMAFAADLARQLPGEFPRRWRRHCARRRWPTPLRGRRLSIALDAEQRRGGVDLAQQGRIVRLRHWRRSARRCAARVRQVALGGVLPIDAGRAAEAALAGQLRQGAQRLAAPSEIVLCSVLKVAGPTFSLFERRSQSTALLVAERAPRVMQAWTFRCAAPRP